MRLTEHDTANITLSMLATLAKMQDAKSAANTAIEVVAYRDAKWIEYIKSKYNIDVDNTELLVDYTAAKERIKNY